ncbi:USP26-like protein [Mya arenaria]|uniref:USP26-like protein n=1 Tax=Mya arenaria TaxID=6604 RepID=A0ABY7EQH9_MYAAR|nr:USP26-like protein [Mya arenaria]
MLDLQKMMTEMAAKGGNSGTSANSFDVSAGFSPSGTTYTGINADLAGLDGAQVKALMEEMARANQGGTGYFNISGEFTSSGGTIGGGTMSGTGLNTTDLDAMLRQLQAGFGGSSGTGVTSGTSGNSGAANTANSLYWTSSTGGTGSGGSKFDASLMSGLLKQLKDQMTKQQQQQQQSGSLGIDTAGLFSSGGSSFTGGQTGGTAGWTGGLSGGSMTGDASSGWTGGLSGGSMGGGASGGWTGGLSGGSMGGGASGGWTGGLSGGSMGGGASGGWTGDLSGVSTGEGTSGGWTGDLSGGSMVGGTSGDWTVGDSQWTGGLTGGAAASGGSNRGVAAGGGSKWTVQERIENQRPQVTNTLSGGRVVGGQFTVENLPTGIAGGLGAAGAGLSGTSGSFTVERSASGTGTGTGIVNRSAPRGASAPGVSKHEEGKFLGLHVPGDGSFINGATVMNRGRSGGFGGRASMQGTGILTDVSGMSGGDFTQMGKVVGSGGGVRRIIDTNVKRLPAGDVNFNPDGGVSLASLGLGGTEGKNIIRHSVRVQPAETGQFTGGTAVGGEFFGTSSSAGGATSSGSATSGGSTQGGFFSGGQGGSMGGGASGGWGASNDLLPFMVSENLWDGVTGKRRKRSTRRRRQAKSTNRSAYQALVTNCQGQAGRPSIMVVANNNDVKFAIKTYNNEPAVINVPAVEGWNDVTLVYDGQTLTGIVENWKGFHRSSVNLKGNVERRQAGLLVGSCEGFQSFHGEIDDLTVYKCLTPEIQALRDQVLQKKK